MNLKSLGPSECDLKPNSELDLDLEQSLKDWTDISDEYAVSKTLEKKNIMEVFSYFLLKKSNF